MQAPSATINPQVRAAIERVLERRLALYGYERADIRIGQDQEGDQILFVDVSYRLVRHPVDPKATFGLATEIRAALSQLGETRFPLIRHHFADAQKIAS